MFDKGVYEKYMNDPQYILAKKKREKLFSTEEGNFRDMHKHDITDENVLSAIDL